MNTPEQPRQPEPDTDWYDWTPPPSWGQFYSDRRAGMRDPAPGFP